MAVRETKCQSGGSGGIALCSKRSGLFAAAVSTVRRSVSQASARRSGTGAASEARAVNGRPFSSVLHSAQVSDGGGADESVSQQLSVAAAGNAFASKHAFAAGSQASKMMAAIVRQRMLIGLTRCLPRFGRKANAGTSR